MSSDEVIIKRLHVSGLTPAISPTDLSAKLGSFGTVKALDGFGALNAVGEPKKFGYITLETTKPQLAKCMNILSGVTWKGTKLRLGEAKPDFRERIAKEIAPPDPDTVPPARKKRRLARGVQGIHALDMSLVTPENVQTRGGWRVTPLGRIVRPIRMRPDHPLPDPLVKTAAVKSQEKKKVKGAGKEKEKKRKRVRDPPTRARRRTIDPTKWDSQHLKGVFLDGGMPLGLVHHAATVSKEAGGSSSEDDSSEDDEGTEAAMDIFEDEQQAHELPTSIPHIPPISVAPQPSPSKPLAAQIVPPSDLREETKNTLGFLQSLFGNKDGDWGGAESVGSDVDVANLKEVEDGDGDDVELVPRAREEVDTVMQDTQGSSSDGDDSEGPEPAKTVTLPPLVKVQKTKLKDLFTPREEEAGFSLLGHLELDDDLDLDEDILGLNLGPSEPSAPIVTAAITAAPVPAATRRFQAADFVIGDASQPLFFPLPLEERGAQKSRIKDPLDVAMERGWDWRTFCRTETEEEIRKRWEETKGDLTRDWKRRHREAVKSRRRRGGFGGDDHE